MDIGSVSPPIVGGYVGSSQAGYTPVFKPVPSSAPIAADIPDNAQPVPATADQARYQEVQQASKSVQANYYVVSDVTFTIFKDLDGNYVTRYTSLKDGSVKYYPQKDLFEQIQILKQRDKAASFHTEA